MKNTFILIFFVQSVFAQQSYKIQILKDSLYAEVKITEGFEEAVFKMGTISFFDAKKDISIIQIDSIEMPYGYRFEDIIESGVQEIPYNQQSLLIYEDFNFDSNPDLAIYSGNFSCYSGPSYDVYLYKNNTFEYNQDFTDLALYNCGFFGINSSKKQLSTFTKSGCCFHSSSVYNVINDVPTEIQRTDSYYSLPFLEVSEYEIINDSLRLFSSKTFFDAVEGDIAEIVSFKLKNSSKKVVIFSSDKLYLNYVLLKNKDEVEFNFSFFISDTNNTFNFETNLLSFTNDQVKYEIFQEISNRKITKIGINVYQNGKKTVLKGVPKTIKGNLNDLQSMKLENLILK